MIKYLINIIKSVLLGADFNPPENLNIDFEQLYSFSKAHHLAGFVALCPKTLEKMPPELATKFIYENNRATAREATQEVIINAFLDEMEKAGLRAMPLKGFYTKHLYPHPALRYMTDTDILIDKERLDEIKPILENLGFVLDHETSHEVICKSRQLVIELHKELVPTTFGKLYDYYAAPWKYANVCEGKSFIHKMSPEDSYVYAIDHIAKHYVEGGIGLMHLIDVFVMNKQELDRNYINTELEKLTLCNFERLFSELANVLFGNKSATDPRIDEMAAFILNSGAYGSSENRIASRMVANYTGDGKKASKLKLIFCKIFPTCEFLGYNYPIVNKYKALYPVFWIVRFFKILFFRTKEIKKLTRYNEVSRETVSTLDEHLRKVGLSKEL